MLKVSKYVFESLPMFFRTRLSMKHDYDMSGDDGSCQFTLGYLMAYVGGAMSQQSRLQKDVGLSTTEAEYMAAVEVSKELIWMTHFMSQLGLR